MLRGPGDTGTYRFLHAWVPWALRRLFRMRVTGLEHVPAEGAVLLAANHRSNLDPIFVGAAFPRQVHFMAKSELWRFPPLGWLITALGSFPVRRGQADRTAVTEALRYLREGGVVGLFPEGHRQKDGRLGQPQAGVGMLASRKGVRAVPVALEGTERIMERRLPRLARVEVRFGPPVESTVEAPSKAARQEEVSRRVMRGIGRLLGQRWTPEAASGDRSHPRVGAR